MQSVYLLGLLGVMWHFKVHQTTVMSLKHGNECHWHVTWEWDCGMWYQVLHNNDVIGMRRMKSDMGTGL